MKNTLSQGARAAVPTVLGYLSIGLAYGIVASETGLSPLETLMTSLFIYSGSGQFVLCALLWVRADLPAIAMTVFLTNLRHFLMNLHTATLFPKTKLWQQLLIGSFLTDESYGVLLGQGAKAGQISPTWMHANNLVSYLSWSLATFIGAALGKLLPDPTALGIDFALIAMFVAIFCGQLSGMLRRISVSKVGLVLMSVLVSFLAFAYLMPSSLAVLGSTLFACFVGVMTDD